MVTGTCVWVSQRLKTLDLFSKHVPNDRGRRQLCSLGDPRVCATRIQKAVESHSNVLRLDEKGVVEGGALGGRVRPVPCAGLS